MSSAFGYLFLSVDGNFKKQISVAKTTISHPDDPDCKSCHIDQWQDWENSHHQKSMQVASKETVLGNFNDEEVTFNGHNNRFYKKEDEFWVTIESKDYKIDYVFGFDPLQQYLIKMSDGKYQTLPLSWDSRAAKDGGQRWFKIYGDEEISAQDRLHWQQPLQNWNGMCADCHSTGLTRGFNPEDNSFSTQWDTVNVSCQSCHDDNNSTINQSIGGWQVADGEKTATWHGSARDQGEIEICAACHSRRTPLTDGFKPSDRFLDAFSPTPILMPEYFPDGQIRDEDYVWGSFLQSKMYANGVICSDCHNPHSLELKTTGNDLCSSCHVAEVYDTSDHHKHIAASPGSQCVDCHMGERTYMGVDNRRDHSFRIPRPDLNHVTNSPDACTNCHQDKSAPWAAEQINTWFGIARAPHYGEVMNAVYSRAPNAEQQLSTLLFNSEISPIIRGSAFELLSNFPYQNSYNAIISGLSSDDALVRLGATKASTFIPIAERTALLMPRLNDEFKVVRVESVRALSDLDPAMISEEQKTIYQTAKQEFLLAQNQVAWRGEGHFNLGIFYDGQNDFEKAKGHYLKAIKIDPYFPGSYINLADQYRSLGNEQQTTQIIDNGLELLPDNADLNYSKALFLIRTGKTIKAIPYLKTATENAPNNAQYRYVYELAKKELDVEN